MTGNWSHNIAVWYCKGIARVGHGMVLLICYCMGVVCIWGGIHCSYCRMVLFGMVWHCMGMVLYSFVLHGYGLVWNTDTSGVLHGYVFVWLCIAWVWFWYGFAMVYNGNWSHKRSASHDSVIPHSLKSQISWKSHSLLQFKSY